MPWYAGLYLVGLCALAVASWQHAARLGGVPRWLRDGDVMSTFAQVLLCLAYWKDEVREALGIISVALLAGVVGWMVFAIGPALECARAALPAERRGLAGTAQGYGVAFLSLLISAPSLFWGLRVSVAALSDP
jgi:hypothetical protein